ncbi:MAG: T9SS type A sorting domain-containing protein [candidate division KSB1 bacterium]|nr:T9SS type A sorting domain-containing protein [candidate division KSB1 bacterium]
MKNLSSWTMRKASAIICLLSSAFTLYADYLPNDQFEPWEGGPSYYAQWPNGPSPAPDFFPLAVWLQSPEAGTAKTYKAIGINTFIGLWQGPTAGQLNAVASLGLKTICAQNTLGLTHFRNNVIIAWLQDDEPDNAQNGTQDPVPPSEVIRRYQDMKAADPTRPVYLNLGQGVACNEWYGRGNRTNHPEDYREYAKGADILSFDVYPMNVFPLPDNAAPWFKAFHNKVAQDIRFVAYGTDNLRKWCDYAKPVWVWIETTNIDGDSRYALTPQIVRAEVWLALIHGARGIGYFCHQFSPTFIEAGLLANAAMAKGVEAVNRQITALAAVLNTPSVSNGLTAVSANPETPVDAAMKRHDGYTYVFAVATRPGSTTVTFTLRDFGDGMVEVIDENRSIALSGGVFRDEFADYAVHLYRIPHSAAVKVGKKDEGKIELGLEAAGNPFNGATVIAFSLPKESRLSLEIYDSLGRKVAALLQGHFEAGHYRVPFLPDGNLSSGVLFCTLQTEQGTAVRKMAYLK